MQTMRTPDGAAVVLASRQPAKPPWLMVPCAPDQRWPPPFRYRLVVVDSGTGRQAEGSELFTVAVATFAFDAERGEIFGVSSNT